MPGTRDFLVERRRRHVFRAALVYGVAAWAVVEIADLIAPALSLPPWTLTLVIVLVALGFPITLVLAWAYRLTPAGLRPERPASGFSAPKADSPTDGRSPGSDELRRLGDLLNRALEQPAERRERLLDEGCRDEREREELESLLEAHSRDGPLDRLGAVLHASSGDPDPEARADRPARTGGASAARADEPRSGETVRQYHLEERLGGGGMGIVFRARDTRLERTVALKFLPWHMVEDATARERFLAEAQAAGRLDHPNICTIHEIGAAEDGRPFIAMACYEGRTLRDRLADGALEPESAVRIAEQVATGLEKAHELGIVHRDIKPANLILTSDGTVKILDFGLAKRSDTSLTDTGATVGTVAYMSPEQVKGEAVDGRTDVWSLGVVLYEALAGRRPFDGPHAAATLHAILHDDPAPPSAYGGSIGPEVDRIVLRSLQKEPAARYPSVAALRGELARLLGSGVDDATSLAGGAAAPTLPRSGERRRACIVVSRVDRFTELVEDLPPHELEAFQRRFAAGAARVVQEHGGVVNRDREGELVALFGIPQAHEDDFARAVAAASALHAWVRRPGDAADDRWREVRIRSGVALGPVVARPRGEGGEKYRVSGDPVELAVRLSVQAGEDEILVSPECQKLIAPYFATEPSAPLLGAGGKGTLTPHRVLGPTGRHTRIEASRHLGLTPYTGRDAELRSLENLLASARAGEGRFVTVVGEAGVGKSRLLYEFTRRLDAAEAPVLHGGCQSYGAAVPYLPFIEALRELLSLGEDERDPAAAAAALLAISGELEAFVPVYLHLLSLPSDAHPLPQHLEGEHLSTAIDEALAGVLTLAARRQPTVLLLEDWHWVDPASMEVLRQLVEMVPAYPLLVVVTRRPGRPVDWGGAAAHTSIHLGPMDREGSATIVQAVLGGEPPKELERLLEERAGGNPFFLEEICRALQEEGAVAVEGGQVRLTRSLKGVELPDTIQGVIRTRLDRLDPEARELLRVAAVIGREFSRSTLERVLEDEIRHFGAALERLRRLGLVQQVRVVPDPAYRFQHVLTQEVAYESLLQHQRAVLHGRVGRALEALPPGRIDEHLDRLVYHFSRAEVWWKAIRYALESAEKDASLSRFGEALVRLDQAFEWIDRLAEPEAEDLRIRLLLRAERVCESLGLRERQLEMARELISLLEPRGESAQLAEAYLRLGDVHTLVKRFDEAERALEESLRVGRALGDAEAERNTLRSLGLLRWHQGRTEEAVRLTEEALRIDRRREDPMGIVGDLANLGNLRKHLGEHERALVHLDEALRLLRGLQRARGDPFAFKEIAILSFSASVHRLLGDTERALELDGKGARLAHDHRLPQAGSTHLTAMGRIHLEDGRIEEGLAVYRQALEAARAARHAEGLAQTLRFLAEALLALERWDEAIPHLREAADLFAQLRNQETETLMWAKLGEACHRAGDHLEAVVAWERARALHRAAGDITGELDAARGLARATREQDPTLALRYYRDALALAERLDDPGTQADVLNSIGILEWERREFGAALGAYERALELFRAQGDRTGTGVALNSLGVTLRSLGRHEEAAQRLRESIALNRLHEQPLLEGHALASLGDLHLEREEWEEAARRFSESLRIRREIGDRRGEGWMLVGLARVASRQGDAATARERAAEALAIGEADADPALVAACREWTDSDPGRPAMLGGGSH
ncbi:MAG: serine/threonine-protein kinase PknK [Gemmatimonadota bacterium]